MELPEGAQQRKHNACTHLELRSQSKRKAKVALRIVVPPPINGGAPNLCGSNQPIVRCDYTAPHTLVTLQIHTNRSCLPGKRNEYWSGRLHRTHTMLPGAISARSHHVLGSAAALPPRARCFCVIDAACGGAVVGVALGGGVVLGCLPVPTAVGLRATASARARPLSASAAAWARPPLDRRGPLGEGDPPGAACSAASSLGTCRVLLGDVLPLAGVPLVRVRGDALGAAGLGAAAGGSLWGSESFRLRPMRAEGMCVGSNTLSISSRTRQTHIYI